MEARSLFRGRGFLWWLLTVCRYKVSPPRLWNPRAPSGSSLEGSRNFNLVPGSSFPRVGQLPPPPPNFEFHHALSFVNIVQRLIRFEKFSLLSFESIIRRINFIRPFVLISCRRVLFREYSSRSCYPMIYGRIAKWLGVDTNGVNWSHGNKDGHGY